MNTSLLNIVLVGCGSIGLRHIDNLLALGQKSLVLIEANSERVTFVKDKYNLPVFSTLEEWGTAFDACDAAVICSPSSLHSSQALWFAKRGAHLFIEKPVAIHLDEISELRRIIAEKNLITMVGYNLRFYPLFIRAKELLDQNAIGRLYAAHGNFGYFLPEWRPNVDYRKTYSAHATEGGGILLDSHEFEYLRWFAGDMTRVFCQAKHVSDLEIDTEDIADVAIEFKSGAFGSLHLDYLQRQYMRNFEFIGSLGSLTWNDNVTHHGMLTLSIPGKSDIVEYEPACYDRSQTYLEEMSHFLRCIMKGAQTVSSVEDGAKCLTTILAAKESATLGSAVEIVSSAELLR
jgi:predicted dehydrogenase